MKKFLSRVLCLAVVIICLLFVYDFLFKCESVNTDYKSNFILKKNDYAKIDGTYYKLIKISNEECLDDECFEIDDYYVKLLIINNKHISYIKLEKGKPQKSEKFDCSIDLVDSNSKEVTLKVNKLEKKNENI